MGKSRAQKYYSKIGDDYFLLFTVDEKYTTNDESNNFVKISLSIQPEGKRKIQTKTFTIHPEIIQIKTDFPDSTNFLGQSRNNPEYEEKVCLQTYLLYMTYPNEQLHLLVE